jgi:hypothetical protein
MSGPFDHRVAVDGAFERISIKKKGPGVKQPVSPILLPSILDNSVHTWGCVRPHGQ